MSIQVKAPNLLPNGSGSWKDVKPVRRDRGVNSLHLRMCPCEDVMVSSEGVLHALGLFWRYEGTDVCEVSTFLRNLDYL